jgi:hypothetical protein
VLVVEHNGQTLLARIGMTRARSIRPVSRRRRAAQEAGEETPDHPMKV